MDTDTRLLESLARLNNDMPVKDYLAQELEAVKSKLLVAPDERAMQRLQGKGEFISKFLDFVGRAPALLDKTR